MKLRELVARWFPPKSLGPELLGKRGEDFAAHYLKRLGYKIVGRSVDLRVGELDIVAVDVKTAGRRTIVFVEVKTRTDHDAGAPAEAVDDLRQQRMTRAALAYLKSHGLLEYPARFDVIALTWPTGARKPTLEHFKDAFPAVGKRSILQLDQFDSIRSHRDHREHREQIQDRSIPLVVSVNSAFSVARK